MNIYGATAFWTMTIAVYSEDGTGDAVYRWNGIDGVYDSIIAAGMRPLVEISFMPQ